MTICEVSRCGCGCGQPTPLAPRSNASKGWVEGQPLKFIFGHANVQKRQEILDLDGELALRCASCLEVKPIDDFNRAGKTSTGVNSWCRLCSCTRGRAYRLEKKYGITAEEYDLMFARQGGLCAICNQPQVGRRLAVDHDHTTGAVRSLLCTSCNITLGLNDDDPARLRKAATYLEAHA